MHRCYVVLIIATSVVPLGCLGPLAAHPTVTPIPTFPPPATATPQPTLAPATVSTPASPWLDRVVYLSGSGETYHVDGCPLLGEEVTPAALSQSCADHLRPCQQCKPPGCSLGLEDRLALTR